MLRRALLVLLMLSAVGGIDLCAQRPFPSVKAAAGQCSDHYLPRMGRLYLKTNTSGAITGTNTYGHHDKGRKETIIVR